MDYEKHLLSRIIADRDISSVVESGITRDFFLSDKARDVFDAIIHHTAEYGEVPSLSAIKLDFPTYQFVKPTDSVEFLIDKMREHHTAALLERGMSEAIDSYDAKDYVAAQESLSRTLLTIAQQVPRTKDIDLVETGDARLDRYRALRDLPDGLRGIPSGFATIDRATQGFQGGQLVTFVGPPKAGKSTVLALASQAAHMHGVTPLIIGFEMTNDETAERLDAFRAEISHSRLRNGTLKKEEWERLEKSLRRMDNMHPFYLSSDSHNTTTLTAVQAKIENLKPDIVFVDGVYMMQDENGEAQGSSQALTNITRGFKRMSMRLDIPIVISTQVLEWKMDKKRGITSGSIGYSSSFAQDSDAVLGVEPTDDPKINKVKIVIARNCPPLETYIQWDWERGLFEELPGNPFEMIGDDADADF